MNKKMLRGMAMFLTLIMVGSFIATIVSLFA